MIFFREMTLTKEAAEVLEDALERYVGDEDEEGMLSIEALDLCIALGRMLRQGAVITYVIRTGEDRKTAVEHI
jgi:hypothetical protein